MTNLSKTMGTSKTSQFYANNPKARAKRLESQKEINKRPEQVKYRVELNKANRKSGKVGDGLDMSHTKSGKLVKEKASVNRARQGSNGKSTLKK